ncbi:hypothetical protein CEXT_793711 [Caerostris extrusa]|uniref:Uncharacterized protein n=1 Tax=Caerostris extrusa TaxID=172846 RepID=A0AAV4NW40_CAEEX|nr:hypothetical protein CEXT_793711 [Caerostris extrusa]
MEPRVRSPNYQKLFTPSNRSLRMWRTSAPSKCYDVPLLGRSSFLIKDDSSAREDPLIYRCNNSSDGEISILGCAAIYENLVPIHSVNFNVVRINNIKSYSDRQKFRIENSVRTAKN